MTNMDVRRQPPRSKRLWSYAGFAVVALVIGTLAIGSLRPADSAVSRSSIFTGVVRRGEMVRSVRGSGRLVSEKIRWIAALTAGRVDRILLKPGATVDSSTTLLLLSNPDVEIAALEAQRQLTAEQARLVTLTTSLKTDRLRQESLLAQIRSQHREANRKARNSEALDEPGLISRSELESARDTSADLEVRLELEERRLGVMTESMQLLIQTQQAQVTRLRAIVDFKRRRVESMVVRSGVPGVLAELTLEEGQWVRPGDNLARSVEPGRLKAELRIPETQARDLAVGLRAMIDTRKGIIPGRVIRVDPAAHEGTVRVDVQLEGPLPKEARPDLTIDGLIELERLEVESTQTRTLLWR